MFKIHQKKYSISEYTKLKIVVVQKLKKIEIIRAHLNKLI